MCMQHYTDITKKEYYEKLTEYYFKQNDYEFVALYKTKICKLNLKTINNKKTYILYYE